MHSLENLPTSDSDEDTEDLLVAAPNKKGKLYFVAMYTWLCIPIKLNDNTSCHNNEYTS